MASPDDGIQAALDELTSRVRAAVKEVVHEQAERIAEAQRDALRGLLQSPDDTGDLMESIRVEDGENEAEAVVMAGGPLTTKTSRSGWEYDYALGFEYGTTKQMPRPFFFPPADAMADDVRKAIQKELAKVLK